MPTVKDISNYLESIAPLSLQEDYDNSGLLIGDPNLQVSEILVTLDVTEELIDEAINNNCNLIVAHHPIIFRGLKRLTGKNYVERCVIKAVKNDIAIYAIHTNLDNINQGVNRKISDKLGLTNTKILASGKEKYSKLITFVPEDALEKVLDGLHQAGAGQMGEYDQCSFRVYGKGRFRGSDNSDPAIGNKGKIEEVEEARVEVILPSRLENKVVEALRNSHPYEEVAYDLFPLNNKDRNTGAGMIGELSESIDTETFLAKLKKSFNLTVVKHTQLVKKEIKKVAICGGAGSFLIKQAIAANADIFISADIKYHDFFDAEDAIIIADIGHYESEVFTKELLQEILTKKFNTFAVRLGKTNTNPVLYF